MSFTAKGPSYSQQDLREAVDMVKKGHSVRAASRKMNVPRRTIDRRLKGEILHQYSIYHNNDVIKCYSSEGM